MPISGIFFWLLISTRDKQMELASDVMTAAGLGLIALGAGGATIVATRMRKKA